MPYQRKTRDTYTIQQYTGPQYGGEDVCTEDTLTEAKQREREYQQNQPEYSVRILKQRKPISIDATLITEWDYTTVIETACKWNTETKEVVDITPIEAGGIDLLTRKTVRFPDGTVLDLDVYDPQTDEIIHHPHEKTTPMELQINPEFTDRQVVFHQKGVTILMTPPIGKDYWWLRVSLTDDQAIIAFPKFQTIGIAFQNEEDWNTNTPYTYSPQKIFDHIKQNKGDESILDSDCISAIELIQSAIAELWSEHDEEHVQQMRKRESNP